MRVIHSTPAGGNVQGEKMIPRSRVLRELAVIIRTPGGFSDFGEWEDGNPVVEVEVVCASAPDTGQERDLGEEGARIEGRRFFWFLPQVDVRLAGDGHTTDNIKHDGVLYRVVEVERWHGSHVRVVGSRVDNQGATGASQDQGRAQQRRLQN